MNQEHDFDRIPGLDALPRVIEPERDLWPGIARRLPPRRGHRALPAWAGLAVAASLLAAMLVPLGGGHFVPASGPGKVPTRSQEVAYYTGQLRLVQAAESELLHALQHAPQSPVLKRLLESTRQRQRELRRLATARA